MPLYDIILSTLLESLISFLLSKSKLISPTHVLNFIFNSFSKSFATNFAVPAMRLIVQCPACFVAFSFFLNQFPFSQKFLIGRDITDRLVPNVRVHHRLLLLTHLLTYLLYGAESFLSS